MGLWLPGLVVIIGLCPDTYARMYSVEEGEPLELQPITDTATNTTRMALTLYPASGSSMAITLGQGRPAKDNYHVSLNIENSTLHVAESDPEERQIGLISTPFNLSDNTLWWEVKDEKLLIGTGSDVNESRVLVIPKLSKRFSPRYALMHSYEGDTMLESDDGETLTSEASSTPWPETSTHETTTKETTKRETSTPRLTTRETPSTVTADRDTTEALEGETTTDHTDVKREQTSTEEALPEPAKEPEVKVLEPPLRPLTFRHAKILAVPSTAGSMKRSVQLFEWFGEEEETAEAPLGPAMGITGLAFIIVFVLLVICMDLMGINKQINLLKRNLGLNERLKKNKIIPIETDKKLE